MRIKKLMNENRAESEEYTHFRNERERIDAEKNVEQNAKSSLLDKIKKAFATIKGNYKLKIDEPGGEDDTDMKTYAKSNSVKSDKDPEEQNIKKTSQMAWDPKDAVDLYKGAKPYNKYRLWKPLDDNHFISLVTARIKQILGVDGSKVTTDDVKLALESVESKKGVDALYENYLGVSAPKSTHSIKLKDLLED